MSSAENVVLVAQAEERLRQERETFNQKKAQDRRWFILRLVMGWTAAALLPLVCALCAYMILNHDDFSPATIAAATAALLVDSLGLVIAVWQLVVGRGPQELGPVTTDPTPVIPAGAYSQD